MKWVVVLLMAILLSSSISADWNINYNNTCGNNAIEMGEDCDPPGKDCYTKGFIEGKCTNDCICEEYFGPSCGNSFVETGEDCESDTHCPMFHYCNANCRCIAKIAPESNKTEVKINEKETNYTGIKEVVIQKDIDSKVNETVVVYEEFVVNESFFERENFSESFGIKITGAVTKVTKSVFGSIWNLIKGWLL